MKKIIRAGEQVNINEGRKVITTEDAISAATNVVLDKPPVVDGPQVSGPEYNEFMVTASEEDLEKIRNLSEGDILTDAVVAVDMRLPNLLDLKPKDPIWVFRWINRKHDSSGVMLDGAEGGNRYETFKANGWTNVLPSEVAGQLPAHIKVHANAVIYDDVILMKMRKDLYYGLIKNNLIKANRSFSDKAVREAAKNKAEAEISKNMSGAGVKRSEYAGKIGVYIPDKIPGAI